MACAAGLLLALAPALCQDAGEVPFGCTLPEGYRAFAAVPGAAEEWEAASADGTARFLIQHFLLESPGARADLVARDLGRQVWRAQFGGLEGFDLSEWQGGWGGLPHAAGHTVRYVQDKRAMAVVERIGIVHDHLVHFTWEGPASGLSDALTCAGGFRVPDAWIPLPPPAKDVHRGSAPGSEALTFPWSLEVALDLVAWTERGVIEVAVRAEPITVGGAPPEADAWRLPLQAISLLGKPGEVRYRLDPKGDPDQLAIWGILVSPQNDLAACDAAWLAAPDPGPGHFLPPAWTLEATHPGHLVVVGPNLAKTVFDEVSQRSQTRFATVPAARSWPFFLAGRFEDRLHAGIVLKLRKDAKALTADLPVAALARLQSVLQAWMPGFQPRASVVSFPGAGDRVLPGLYVLDETREWFSQPMDSLLGTLTRRSWLARMAAASCFGVELRGSGNGAPVLENALAEYAAARLLEAADWQKDAEALRAWWNQSEQTAGELPMPLTLLPPEDVLGSQRILTAGARFWTNAEKRCGRTELDGILRQVLAAGQPWNTEDLVSAGSALGKNAASRSALQSFFEQQLYAIPPE